MPHFDRFDITEAYWLFFSHYHEGQGSRKYQRLSRMNRYFSPRSGLNRVGDLTPNSRAIYEQLVREWVRDEEMYRAVARNAERMRRLTDEGWPDARETELLESLDPENQP